MKVLYVQYANPGAYPPLEHSSHILAGHGWQVLVLGINLRGTEALHFAPHPKIEIRLLKYCPPGWRQKLHFLGFGLWTLGWVLRWRPKWVYASDPFACPVALALSFLPGLRVIYHEHDSPSEERGSQKSEVRNQTSAFIRFVLWTRRQVARRAAFCVLPNEKRVEHFKGDTGTARPVLCVWNCPRREESEEKTETLKAEKLKSDEGRQQKADSGQSVYKSLVTRHSPHFTLFYHGSIVPARLPLTVLQAVSQLPGNVRFQMAGYETIGHPGYIAALKAEAERLGIRERFEYLGAIPTREELLPLCRKADVGLSLMPAAPTDINEKTMTGASNKPFDYLACGLALLVSDLPDWKKVFVEPGYGLACNPDDPQSIAQALRWFVEHPEETRQMGERGRQRILNDWNYEKQFGSVLKTLNDYE